MPDDENMWSDRKLDDVLAALHADVPATPDARARARAKLMLAANAGVATEQRSGTPQKITRAIPLAGVAAAVAVVAVGAVLVVNAASQNSAPATIPPAPSSTTAPVRPPATQGSQHAPLPPTPGQPRNAAADLASRIPDTPLAPHQHLYVARQVWQRLSAPGRSGATYIYIAEGHAETWIPADQRQLWMARGQTTGNRHWINGSEQAARADGVDLDHTKLVRPDGAERARCGDFDFLRERGKQPCEQNPPGTVPTTNGPVRPPTDPRELYAWLAQNSAALADPPLQFFRTATNLLDARFPAELRRATLQALSYHPYLTVTEASTKDGRPAVALSIDYGSGSLREQVLLDPANGQLIGRRTVCLKDVDGAKAGDIILDEVRHQAVVDNLGDKPTR